MLEEKGLLESRDNVRVDSMTTVESIIFNQGGNKMKLELIRHPKEIEKKTIFSKRIGAPVSVSSVYSQDENVLTLKAFKWNSESESWEPFDASQLM